MRNNLKNITIYSICIIVYSIIIFFIASSIMNMTMHYLFIAIPLLVLVIILMLNNIIKMLSLLCLLSINNKSYLIEQIVEKTNKLTTYSVVGVFISLLTSVIILDIYICIKIGKYILAVIAVIVWIFTIVSLIKCIKVFMKEKILKSE